MLPTSFCCSESGLAEPLQASNTLCSSESKLPETLQAPNRLFCSQNRHFNYLRQASKQFCSRQIGVHEPLQASNGIISTRNGVHNPLQASYTVCCRQKNDSPKLYVKWGCTNTTDTSVFMMKISHILRCEGKNRMGYRDCAFMT